MARPRTPLPDRASVVIVGGGVIGASIAFHLAEAGVADVLLLERNELGSGSTCRAAGGVRAQFSDELNIALGARSLAAFTRFRDRPGQEIDLHQVGYLFLLSTQEDVASFERDVALQNKLGVTSRMIDVDEARRLSPLIATDGLLAAAFSPDDGHCTPESVVLGYAGAARRHPPHRHDRARHRDQCGPRDGGGDRSGRRRDRRRRLRGRRVVGGCRRHGRC
jgi:sarcosine oxidase subunit beta